jgi:hypothetical protein
MVFYTEKLSYKELQVKSDSFQANLPELEEIQTLSKGGRKLKPEEYLLIRDYEKKDITQKRKENFSPLNYLGAAIRLQKVNQNSGSLEIDKSSLPGDSEFWRGFLDKFKFKDFILDVFEEALITQKCYVQIENPVINLNIPSENLNLAQLEELKRDNKQAFYPYAFIIPIQSIMSQKVVDGEIQWIKYRKLVSIDNPFKKTTYNLEYILLDKEHTSIWTFENVLVDHCGDIKQIWDSKINQGRGGYRMINKEKDFASVQSQPHGRIKCPVIYYSVTDSLYMADQVKDAQRLIYGLMMNCIHTVRNAGFVQKWGQPYVGGVSSSRDSGGVSYMPLPKQALDEMVKQTAEMLGDESFLYLQHLSFEEITGSSVDVVLGIIEFLRKYIFTSILFNDSQFEKSTANKVDSQSGRSKEIDFHIQNLALKKHGSTLIDFSRILLQHFCYAIGLESQTPDINVSGMDKFDILPLEMSLELVERLFALPKEAIPEEILSEALIQLSRLMISNDSDEYKALLDSAIINKVKDYVKIPNLMLLGQASQS